MKRIILLASLMVMLVLVGLPVIAQDDGADCDPDLLGEWLLARQTSRNQIGYMFSEGANFTVREGTLEMFRMIEELDTMERPACADELYLFTRTFFQAVFEYSAIYYATGDEALREQANTRLESVWGHYQDNIDSYIDPLDEIVGFDSIDLLLDMDPVEVSDIRPALLEYGDLMTVGSDIYGPYDIAPGFYVATFITDTGAGLDIVPVDGNCRLNMGDSYSRGAVNDRESLDTAECRFVIDVERYRLSDAAEVNWTLTLERID